MVEAISNCIMLSLKQSPFLIFLPLMNILVADEGTDLINIAAMTSAGIVASRSAFLRNKDHKPDLQIEYK